MLLDERPSTENATFMTVQWMARAFRPLIPRQWLGSWVRYLRGLSPATPPDVLPLTPYKVGPRSGRPALCKHKLLHGNYDDECDKFTEYA